MTPIRELGFSFCPPVIANLFESGPSETSQEKVNLIWKRFSFMIASEFNLFGPSIQQSLQNEIDQIEKLELTKSNSLLCSHIRRTFAKSMVIIHKAGLNPDRLPKKVALQFAVILTKFGMALSQSRDVKLECALDVLKAAILMQQYALGISKYCPELSKLLILDGLYTDPKIYEKIRPLADEAIKNLKPHVWSASTFLLTRQQFLLIPKVLFYTEEALYRLKQMPTEHSRLLVDTAIACLLSVRNSRS